MVAYSFQARFELPIVGLTKLGTIRANGRRRHAAPGDSLQLYYGLRTKSCRLIARATCDRNDAIRMNFATDRVITSLCPGQRLKFDALDLLAQGDGFTAWPEMKAFWLEVHGAQPFSGRWIRWTADSVRVAI